MTDHERRLRRLEARTPADPMSGPIPMLQVPTLLPADQARFRAAQDAGDTATVDALFEEFTGQRPGSGHPVNAIVVDLHPACREGGRIA